MAEAQFDLIVLGAGPGGYVAAIRAGQLGLRTAVVEKDPKLGGTCLLRGCIPTKALLHTAAVLEEIRGAGGLGIGVGEPTLDMARVQARKQKVVDGNASGVAGLFRKSASGACAAPAPAGWRSRSRARAASARSMPRST
jgi:dihydrolipoamide dehydrogenase